MHLVCCKGKVIDSLIIMLRLLLDRVSVTDNTARLHSTEMNFMHCLHNNEAPTGAYDA